MKSRHDFPTQAEYYEYLRSIYAGQAMQGLLADTSYRGERHVAGQSVKFADALINELNKTEENGK